MLNIYTRMIIYEKNWATFYALVRVAFKLSAYVDGQFHNDAPMRALSACKWQKRTILVAGHTLRNVFVGVFPLTV